MKNPLYCETCGYINVSYKEEKCPICECKLKPTEETYDEWNIGNTIYSSYLKELINGLMK